MTMYYTCGIDIGTKNLCISFVPVAPQVSTETIVISYKGSLESVSRYQTGEEASIIIALSKKEASQSHSAYIKILQSIPEFRTTQSVVIEEQLAMNKGEMARLDGVTYGFLIGSFPTMTVNLHGSGIRRKFIMDSLVNKDISSIVIPRGYPDSKELSFYYVGCLYADHYEYVQLFPELKDKMDDICDSVVYACFARIKLIQTTPSTRNIKK